MENRYQLSPTAKIEDFRNNCVLVALKEATRLPDQVLLKTALNFNWTPNQGIEDVKTLAILKELGFTVSQRSDVIMNLARVDTYWNGKKCGFSMKFGRATLARVADQLMNGTYLVTTKDHMLVVRDGVVIDTNYSWTRGSRRRITQVYHVVNAPEIPQGEYVEIVRKLPWRDNARRRRYYDMQNFVWRQKQAGVRVTPDVIFANTSYTQADFSYDLRLGNVRLV